MASNETVAEIVDTVRHLADNLNNGIFLTKGQCNYISDRIKAAHKREIAAKDRKIETLEMVLKISNGMNDAAAEMAVAKNEEALQRSGEFHRRVEDMKDAYARLLANTLKLHEQLRRSTNMIEHSVQFVKNADIAKYLRNLAQENKVVLAESAGEEASDGK